MGKPSASALSNASRLQERRRIELESENETDRREIEIYKRMAIGIIRKSRVVLLKDPH